MMKKFEIYVDQSGTYRVHRGQGYPRFESIGLATMLLLLLVDWVLRAR